jgi:NADH-quinone oxidoreductase subunit E
MAKIEEQRLHEEFGEILSSFRKEREELIPILQKLQEKLGYLPEEAISEIADFLGIFENEVFGVASFYTVFRFFPPGEHIVKVCLGTACHVRGGEEILETMKRELGINPGDTTKDSKFSLERVACFGCCALLPKHGADATIIEVGCIGLLLWQGYPRNCKAKSTESIEIQARKLESPKNRKGGLNCVEDHKKRKMAR